ncbi:MAG: FKBP-type peptidyl-prolyl cis-trans isomerase N-terminal domain-containing protein [Sphaerochaetaceae bacterium]|jgi:FKBP-type peptidyl-prolyl cis-trans isomerase|nr:FKBP-type peptidyl-prolyl cis-trans isomerase [Sphaerochaetaceae bacterium]NLO61400.1 hypothetical protein [Spirochaetales bacterium]MDD2407121.1 FKBP-type peptidyl-prolyl cis-trans isomerase N-terminal domain-containing protein [Sphaerochaetaceae bacterium]MDD3671325.1 FKBP-type peptidyl-prolyl cis-trans isomerase N-terminal domain-containing protein [Sphaerochaetaceae bacterium]MDD4258898.1 FKBP-type peptidyl-prolyl cis-trans isomerase N-terminal domain-containing protein [Sphaerochaetacea
MKKRYVLILFVLAVFLFASCATKATEPTETISQPAIAIQEAPVEVPAAEEPVPVESAEVEVVESEPAEVAPAVEEQGQAVAETPVEEPVVVSETTISDAQIIEQFSYVYGHLLGTNIASQGVKIHPAFFALGSSDFVNYADMKLTMEDVNQAFVDYQAYLDGTMEEATVMEGASDDPMVPKSLFERFSYGYGYLVMYNVMTEGITVDIDRYNAGITDATVGVPLTFSDEEINGMFAAYEDMLYRQYQEAMDAFANENLAQAEAFLAENAVKEGVVTTTSGLQYKVITEGNGKKPTSTDTIKVDYKVSFIDGTTGDNSYDRGEPSVFSMLNLIPGFVEGAEIMSEGGYYQFYIHPDLAYGELGNDAIPPNTLLIMDVELHEVMPVTE